MLASPAVVDVRRDGDAYVVHASGAVAAGQRLAWNTLTDYEALPDFMPDITASRVVVRDGNRLIVEQVGAFRLLFLSVPVRVRLAVEHQAPRLVLARSEPGRIGTEEATLRSFAGRYVVTALPGPTAGARVDYDARFELAEALPGIVGSVLGQVIVTRWLRSHFEAMLAEIERRQGSQPVGKR